MPGHGRGNWLVFDCMVNPDSQLSTPSDVHGGVLVTGATGFVGRHLVDLLDSLKCISLHTLSRSASSSSQSARHFQIDLYPGSDLSDALAGVSVVVHLAGLAAVQEGDEKAANRVNVDTTLSLVQQAAAKGVQRFIFISSIKVLGEEACYISPFTEESPLAPADLYARSKAAAETKLLSLCDEPDFDMDIIIIRPPLVYGPGVKGNFKALVTLALTRLPLPFALAKAPRSMVYVGNLVDFVNRCITADLPSKSILHVSDNKPVSIAELIGHVRQITGKPLLLLPFPITFFSLMFRLLGKKRMAHQLFSPSVVNDDKSRALTGWSPKFSLQEGLRETVRSIQQEEHT